MKQLYTSLKTKIEKEKLKNVRICRFFQILTYISFRQTNAIKIIFILQVYARNTTANQIIQQSYNSSNTHILSLKIEKRTQKLSEAGGFFQILTHDDYKETNGIQLEIFCKSTMLGILQHFKELSIIHFKDHRFEFKS